MLTLYALLCARSLNFLPRNIAGLWPMNDRLTEIDAAVRVSPAWPRPA